MDGWMDDRAEEERRRSRVEEVGRGRGGEAERLFLRSTIAGAETRDFFLLSSFFFCFFFFPLLLLLNLGCCATSRPQT